jgi:hypothetical protein
VNRQVATFEETYRLQGGVTIAGRPIIPRGPFYETRERSKVELAA